MSAVAGFALLGVGLSCLMPTVLRVAGRLPDSPTGPSVAAVSSAGWIGVVGGPPLIGMLASAMSLPLALAIIVGLNAVIFLLAPAARLSSAPAPDLAREMV